MADLAVSTLLNSAADLIEPEGAWTQRVMARDANGYGTWPSATNATCFCLVGALRKVSSDDSEKVRPAMQVLSAVIGTGWLGSWNDDAERTQKEVVDALRRAAIYAGSMS